MDEVSVSVILPVYGVEKWLPACLDSILGQSLRSLEIIAVDDASPDRCGEILDEYAGRDTRLRVFHLSENRRQGHGRNLGLEKARGRYVYFLDSDDLIKAETLETLFLTAEKDSLDGVFFDSEVLFERESFQFLDYEPVRKGGYEDRVYSGAELFERFYAQNDWNVYVWRQFWRRSFLQREGIRFPAGEHEDEVFSVEAAVLASRVRYLPERFPIHRYREDSVMTRSKSPRDFHGYFCAFRELSLFAAERCIHLASFDANLAHLYELTDLYFPLFREEEAENWFRDREELRAYLLYVSGERARLALRRKIRSQWEKLSSYRYICIYGAGRIAQRVLRQLEETNLRPVCILVTSLENNAASLGGIPVRQFDSWDGADGTAVVIAVAPGQQEEIAAGLRGKNCDVYRYVRGEVFPIRKEER